MTDYSLNVYLGEFPLPDDRNPYLDNTPSDWALTYIQHYGGIGGDHHKTWVLDQVARILNGTRVKVVEARWGVSANHPEGETNIRFWTEEPSPQYHEWVAETKSGEDGPETYDYDEGVAP